MPHAGLIEVVSLLIGTLVSVRGLDGLLSGVGSEVGLGSDSRSLFTQDCVRSWLGFGLRFAFFRDLCPKLSWVQTQNDIFLGIVSEVGLGSDSERLFSGACVRWWTGFGLKIAFYPGLCPKLRLVQTQEDIFLGIVSEVGLGSDSGSLFSGICVRSWTGFGLRMTFFRDLCPNLDWVRTQDRFLPRIVSEVGLGSDSGSLFSGICVRSWTGFGLRMTFFRDLCPNLDWVRTQDRFLPRFVSEVGLGSDSGSLFTRRCVRSWAGFGLRMTFFRGLCPKLDWIQTQNGLLPGFGCEAGSCPDTDNIPTKIKTESSDALHFMNSTIQSVQQ
ncbi:hypothetical protein ABE66_08320 [Cytobacillus firmus]|nr:hypothetical protein [Cytobacillus firmus]